MDQPEADRAESRCRLTLTIGSQDYRLRPLSGDAGSGVVVAWRLAKLGTETRHDVAGTLDGATCGCGDQTSRHEGRDAAGCKHIRALRLLC